MKASAMTLGLALVLLLDTAGGLRTKQSSGQSTGQSSTQRERVEGTESALMETAAASSLAEVIEILGQMLTDFDTQGTEDKANWEKYSQWSDDAETEKNNLIQEQQALVMSTEATKAANEQQVAKLTDDLAQLAADIASTVESLQELEKMRKEEHAAFQEGLADMVKTIKAVTKATEILEGHYAAGVGALAEIRRRVQLALTMYGVRSTHATQANVQALTSFLQGDSEGPDFLNKDGSQYDSYQKQGGAKGVVGMLTDLRADLESQKEAMIAKENDSRRQYEATKLAKEADLKHQRQIQAEKQAEKQHSEATIEQCISTIAEAKQEIEEAQKYLEELLADRAKFAASYKKRVAMRSAERGATQAALDALQAVSAGAKAGVGESAAASFVQLGMSTQAESRIMSSLDKLSKLGEQTKQPSLVQLAHHLKHRVGHRHKHKQKDPMAAYMGAEQASFYDNSGFGPVLKLLNDLIVRLEEEQSAETSQHEWCETEKESGVASQQEREKITGDLKGTIESLTTQIAQLKTEILFLESEIARVEEENRIAKEIRAQEHAVYVKAKADHEEVIHAIETALEALSGQYGFIQLKQMPDTPFSEYQSGAGGAGSAMEMLQDLLQRYSAALQKINADEEASQKAHDDLIAKNEQFIADTTNTRNSQLSQRRGLLNDLADSKTEMKDNLVELHEVSKYLMDLRPSCDDIRSTFEERKKRREAEIAALKEALEVISDPSSMA